VDQWKLARVGKCPSKLSDSYEDEDDSIIIIIIIIIIINEKIIVAFSPRTTRTRYKVS